MFENEIVVNFLSGAVLIIGQLLLTIIVFFIAKSIGNKVISRGFSKMAEQRNVTQGRIMTLEKLSKNAWSYTLFFVFVTIVLTIFDLNPAGLIAGAGVIGLAIGFGAQGLVSDIVTGFFLLLERQIDVEDYVTIGGLDGIVEEVGIRTTKIRGFDGTLHYIPNREIGSVSNHSRGNMRALVDISISYDDDITKAMEVLQTVCDKLALEMEEIVEGPDVVGVQALGNSDVVLRIVSKTTNMNQWAVERRLRKEIKEALDANGIEIPFPHQVYITKSE
ncbi:mechanosensitive ion channel family protein [Alkalihalobacillus sp. LMS39]|uniref:mechanosensitive ion channel family protein n=1 Tax=Alkalihalobacillus sp. LMS39 TaxID=2924032 RepID=UPI001FB1FA4B|nr:mechanosensitive ion channel family protein [Alkalihalobacillus sp. LMS39]UOE93011.1 mechanosensitive ion channel family protein [Alkalihalobacillus sp. LMS39]